MYKKKGSGAIYKVGLSKFGDWDYYGIFIVNGSRIKRAFKGAIFLTAKYAQEFLDTKADKNNLTWSGKMDKLDYLG